MAVFFKFLISLQSWIATDFDDGDNDDDFFAAVAEKVSFGRHGSLDSSLAEQQTRPSSSKRPRKRSRNGQDKVSLSFIQEEDDSGRLKDDMWCHRHAPNTTSKLAVHYKKVEEVRTWMENEFSHNKKARSSSGILVLRGPPGCGKSATVRALSADMGLAVQEWMPPSELVAFKKEEDAFGSEGDGSRAGDTVQYVSQTKAFRDFLLRAKRYGVLSGQIGGGNVVNKQKIVG